MKKQDDMRKKYQSSKLKFYIGDVRDYNSILNATRGVDYIYHAAALKQVLLVNSIQWKLLKQT
jgi:UDP-glucose 4-epimerase